MFELHPQLGKDTHEVARFDLCRVLLMDDRQYPWLVLVPERPDLRDLHDLAETDREVALAEIMRASEAMQRLYSPDKMNVAALGNAVPQLHIHVIARFTTDPAWPKPVWGVHPMQPYDDGALDSVLADLRDALGEG